MIDDQNEPRIYIVVERKITDDDGYQRTSKMLSYTEYRYARDRGMILESHVETALKEVGWPER